MTVTGHSLGGTHAEIMAARYHLGGEAFNGYGAVDLSYGIREGQPQDAPAFINYVKATDIVSAASRHYGEVRGYATEQDVDALRQGRYLDPAAPAHPANPMITGRLGAHFITNFAPDAGDGSSLLTAQNEARYRQYGAAFQHFRHDVLTSRVALHDALTGSHTLANTVSLHGQLDDALEVAAYRQLLGGVEEISGVRSAQRHASQLGSEVRVVGSAADAAAESSALTVRADGERLRRGAETASHGLQVTGEAWRAGSDRVAGKASRLASLDPMAAGVIGLGAVAAGALGLTAADDMAAKVGIAGNIAYGINERTAEGLHEAGKAMHEGSRWASDRMHETASQAQHIADALISTKAYDQLSDALRIVPRLDHPDHPDHPMYQQAFSKVQKLDADHGRASDQHSINLAGSLVASAKAAGLRRIDQVTLSHDGSRAFASEHVLGRTFQRHAATDTAQAVSTPLEHSSMQAASQHAAALLARPSPEQAVLHTQPMTRPLSH